MDATDVFGDNRVSVDTSNLEQLGKLVSDALNDKNLKIGDVHQFFWSMVETYVDRYQTYPFDINKALISFLEMKDYPEETVRELIMQLESEFQQIHGRPLRKPEQLVSKLEALDDELKQLRDSLKYAAMVAEGDDAK